MGISPTAGVVGRSGIVPYSATQDAAGPICRTVADAACVLDAIAGYDPDDALTAREWRRAREAPYSAFLHSGGAEGKRIGVLRSFFGNDPVHGEVCSIAENALESLRCLGAHVVDIDVPYDSDDLVERFSLHLHELKEHLGGYLERLPAGAKIRGFEELLASKLYRPGIEETLLKASGLSAESDECARRFKKCAALADGLLKLFEDYGLDALFFPHQKRPVVPVGEAQVERNGVLGAITGFPSVVVPAGFTFPTTRAPAGIPVGVEFLGRPFDEGRILQTAYAFEQATRHRRPPLL